MVDTMKPKGHRSYLSQWHATSSPTKVQHITQHVNQAKQAVAGKSTFGSSNSFTLSLAISVL
jgi:hypothetical protein